MRPVLLVYPYARASVNGSTKTTIRPRVLYHNEKGLCSVNSSQLKAVHIPLAITDIGLSGGRNASNGWRNQTKTRLLKLLHALCGVVFAT